MLRPMFTGLIADVASWYILAFFRATMAAAIRVMPRQTMSTGITSRHLRSFVGSWRKFVPSRYERGPDVLIPSFQPAKGERVELSTMEGRTTAIGKSRPRRESIDSPRLLVNVYMFGQPRCRARRIPARPTRLRDQ